MAAKSLVEPLEACRPHEGLKSEAPKHPEILGRAIKHAPHREAFISNVKSGCPKQAGMATRAHRPRKVTHLGRPIRLAEP
jgi:hypothetical protein